jgi:RNA polymerase sigma factor (sigma-70 family)
MVRRHGRLIHNLCRRILGDAHRAADAFQATFFVLARKADRIRNRDSLASWLYGVAYRIAVRARTRMPLPTGPACERADMTQRDPSIEAAWRELQPLLDRELDRLPEKYRAPLLLCCFEGKSHAEAADLLCWPSGTVKGRLARARELLRERLARRGLTLLPAVFLARMADRAMAAPVPANLIDSTIQAAIQLAAGSATPAGLLSAGAVGLSKGELHSMFFAKLKILTAVCVMTGMVAWMSVSAFEARADRPGPLDFPVTFQDPAGAAGQGQAKAAPPAAAKDADFQGRWTAKIEFGGESALVRIDLQNEGNRWKGTVRVSKDKMFELTKIRIAGPRISFDCEADECELSLVGELRDGTVSGTLEALTKKDGIVEGTWSMSRR